MSRELRNEKIARFHTGIFFRRFSIEIPMESGGMGRGWNERERERSMYVCVCVKTLSAWCRTRRWAEVERAREWLGGRVGGLEKGWAELPRCYFIIDVRWSWFFSLCCCKREKRERERPHRFSFRRTYCSSSFSLSYILILLLDRKEACFLS